MLLRLSTAKLLWMNPLLKTQEIAFQRFKFYNFLGGACHWTPKVKNILPWNILGKKSYTALLQEKISVLFAWAEKNSCTVLNLPTPPQKSNGPPLNYIIEVTLQYPKCIHCIKIINNLVPRIISLDTCLKQYLHDDSGI